VGSDPRPAVFLDRDGTINAEVDYLCEPGQLQLLPGVDLAIARLVEHGYLTLVVTNQSGVARGKLTEEKLDQIHARLEELLAPAGASLDGVYYCPHHPDFGVEPLRQPCDCRKPLPGLFQQACLDHEIDLASSWAVGDSPRDLEAAAAMGVPGLLVESGKPITDELRRTHQVVPDLPAAVDVILAREANGQ
jgi:D-glycero-D-manno-heptose 1,7-bisphosphate phosphatase